ncbi:LysR family transcriptional regulator, partial [Brucella gallinifaecis]
MFSQRWLSKRRDNRGGSVCLNSFGRFVKWISAAIMPPPS